MELANCTDTHEGSENTGSVSINHSSSTSKTSLGMISLMYSTVPMKS